VGGAHGKWGGSFFYRAPATEGDGLSLDDVLRQAQAGEGGRLSLDDVSRYGQVVEITEL
jgi:hypothetical protein